MFGPTLCGKLGSNLEGNAGWTQIAATGLKGKLMAYVTPREGENPESLVNRFRASVQHSGILRELKDRRFFRSKAQKERLAAQRAARRRRRQNRR